MDACRACGAHLSEDLDWCGQCLTPVQRVEVGTAADPRGPAAPWARQPGARAPEEAPKTQFSRWKAGPTSFGAGGRILLTLAILVGVVIGYPMLRGFILAAVGFDLPGTGFMIMYAALAVPACIYLIAKVWKRARVV